MPKVPKFRGNMPRSLACLQTWTDKVKEPALAPDLPIIDPHHHLFDDERGTYLGRELQQEISSGHRVVSTVYVQFKAKYRQDGPLPLQPLGEVEFASGIATESMTGRYGNLALCEGIVGHADLLLGDEVQPVLEGLIEVGRGRLKGIRYGATWDDGDAGTGRTFAPRHLLQDEKFRRGFARLSPLGLSFDAWLFYHQLPDLVGLLTAFPETPVVLDHCGGVLGIPPHLDRSQVWETWLRHIRRLAEFPNLCVKIGGLGMLYSGWDFHDSEVPPISLLLAEAWRPYVEACIEAFGPDRCMFESNFPVDKQSCSYGALWNAFKRITGNYSVSEKAALFHDTASRVYRLGR